MRILITTALYPPAVGGAATHFDNIASHLTRYGDVEEVTILTERMPGEPASIVTGKLCLLRLLPTRVSAGRKPLPTHAATYILTQGWFALRLRRLVRARGLDLIHFHTRFRGRHFFSALRHAGVPVIADLHDKMADPTRLASVADHLLCCGEGVLRFAVEGGFSAQRATYIPLAFEPPDPRPPREIEHLRHLYALQDDRYLLFVGDITYSKGVYELLDAFAGWQRHHPGVRLLLVGTNREGRRFLKRLRLAEGVTYLGAIPHAHVLGLMQSAAIVLLPSRSEGLPRVMLEAIGLGRKVICPPDIPEFDRYCPDFVLEHVEVSALVRKMEAVWQADRPPTYPFALHRPPVVVEQLHQIYKHCLEANDDSA